MIKIGEGTYAEVYLFKSQLEEREQGWPKRVVAKVSSCENQKWLKDEYKVLLYLRESQYIPKVVTFSEIPENSSLLMEYKGTPLNRHKFSFADVESITKQLLEALQFIHGKNIVHGDLKPANIVYDHKTKRVTIIDFGLAFNIRKGSALPIQTCNYRAPEIWHAMKQKKKEILIIPEKIDIWSLGIIVAEMLLGWHIIYLCVPNAKGWMTQKNFITSLRSFCEKITYMSPSIGFFYEMLQDMLQINYQKRLSASDLSKKYFS
jgi:serine/threonine protein kinase